MVAIACASILFFAAAFHVYWGLGGRRGYEAAIPQHPTTGEPLFNPSPFGAHLVGGLLVIAAVFVLAAGGIISLPVSSQVLRALVALLAVIFTVRAIGWFQFAGFFKKVRNTRFAHYDTLVYCPLCLVLGLGLTYVLLHP